MRLCVAAAKQLLKECDTFVFDCDGVLWKGADLITGAIETIQYIKNCGKRTLFLTNNSLKSRDAYVQRFESLGFSGIQETDIVSSAYVASEFLASMLPPQSRVFVCGGTGIYTELERAGLMPCTPFEHEYGHREWSFSEVEALPLLDDVRGVVCGLDINMSYPKLAVAARYIKEKSAIFIATNADATLPMPGGFLPGAGSTVGAIATVTGKNPIVTGKPSLEPLLSILSVAASNYDATRGTSLPAFSPHRAIMIGDRFDTDINFGLAANMKTLLVLSGVTQEQEAQLLESEVDWIADTIADLCTSDDKVYGEK